jgi:hypothetical protein
MDCQANISIGDKKINIYNKEKGEVCTFDTMLANIEILRQQTDETLQMLLDQNKTISQSKEEEEADN